MAHGYLDEDLDNVEFYGEDPDGPSPFEDSANNVIVDTVSINNGEDLARDISYHLDLYEFWIIWVLIFTKMFWNLWSEGGWGTQNN